VEVVPAEDGSGYYVIYNEVSNKVVDVAGASTSNGALIRQWDYLGGANQQWSLVPTDNGYWAIVNRTKSGGGYGRTAK